MDAVQLTRALVDIESTTGAEAAAGEYLYAHLAKLANRTGGVSERMAGMAQRVYVLGRWGNAGVTLSKPNYTLPPFFWSRAEDEIPCGGGSGDAKRDIAGSGT